MAWYNVAEGQKISAAHYNLAIDQGVLAFPDGPTRDFALEGKTKHIGMTCYLQDVKVIFTWDGTDWIDVIAPSSPGVTDHGALTGLTDDDHPQYVLKSGGTMTGLLTLSGAPTAANHASTKTYVDGKMPTATAVLKVGAAGSAPAAGGLADGSVYFGF